MGFFTTTYYILIFSLAIGFLFSIVIFVPIAIYIIPFCLWVGHQNCIGKYRELREGGVFRTIRHATALYISWILHRTPVFK